MNTSYPLKAAVGFDRPIPAPHAKGGGYRLRPIGVSHRRPIPIASRHRWFRPGELVATETGNGLRTGVLVLSDRRELLVQTPDAPELLRHYLPSDSFSGEVPPTLDDWLNQSRDVDDRELVLEGGRRRLAIKLVSDAGLLVLLLTEQPKPMTAEVLRGLDLTVREAEVLSLVIQGKTNWEVGSILGLSQRTVDKHVEHILEKLGAENRTTAMRIAMERCGY